MTEKLLQFIWQSQYFDQRHLQTSTGEKISILNKGNFNRDQGPDFLNGRIRIGRTEWAGSIELHVKSSDWTLHQHSQDPMYKNVILHVVWVNDREINLSFPVLELESRVSVLLLENYDRLMQSPAFIPCDKQIAAVPYLHFTSWKQRLLVERLQQKALHIEQLLSETNQHWEEVFWWLLARNFGIKVNADAFERIARTIPIGLLAKHKNQIQQMEALLLGQAAILDKHFTEAYPKMLRKEYEFLRKKYGLKKAHAPLNYLRMRPANFPSIRFAQLAMLIHQSSHLFSVLKEATSISELEKLLTVTANDYWHYHYMPDMPGDYLRKTLGKQMVHNIIINTVVPVLYTYGYIHNNEACKEKALRWMEQLSAEQNIITRGFAGLGITNKTAFDSQALIQLKREYCDQKACLQCSVGNWLLKGKQS
jgi:hypothetical protein